MNDSDGPGETATSIVGNGPELHRRRGHPYIDQPGLATPDDKQRSLASLNHGRDSGRGPAVRVTYYFELRTDRPPLEGLVDAGRMVLEHGTLKPWDSEGRADASKPPDYDAHMSWATDIDLLGYNGPEGMESGLVEIAYPLEFFDKRADERFPLAQFFMAAASEPYSAFSFYQASKIVDVALPEDLVARLPGPGWSHRRVRSYLGLPDNEPIVGTIVKPKTGLTPELFARCVVEAAEAGAHFTKADENMHLTLAEIPEYVGRVVAELRSAGFDLGQEKEPSGRRFLFAPHITTDADQLCDYAEAAVRAGANALMFSPHYAGGFPRMADVAARFDVPVYAHTAGMNVVTGSANHGVDPRVMYVLAGYFGAAFMQITTPDGYLKPTDAEKPAILEVLAREGLEGPDGMTLAIAGGLAPDNVGRSLAALGSRGRMLLAGTSVYSHPDGPRAGVTALRLAATAYLNEGITDSGPLVEYARRQAESGAALLRALQPR